MPNSAAHPEPLKQRSLWHPSSLARWPRNVRFHMPVLRVTKNDKQLCVVGSDDVWSFSASVSGDIWGQRVQR